MLEGKFGLEKESLRVTEEGFLTHTPHPFSDDSHMERDFCENQTELITDACDSVDAAWEQLGRLQKKAVKILQMLERAMRSCIAHIVVAFFMILL